MRSLTTAGADQHPSVSYPPEPGRRRNRANTAARWLTARLAGRGLATLRWTHIAVICVAIFGAGLGVRLLYWQDTALQMARGDSLSQNMARQYRREARRILEDGTVLFPRQTTDPGDARLIVHPPGYSIVMAATFKLFGESETPLRWLQIILDSAAGILVFLIAAELLPLGAAVMTAALMASSPHFAYYSLRLSPDSLAVAPVLLAIYLIARTLKQPRPLGIAAAGAMLGLSCWLRANSLLLAPFLAIAAAMLIERGRRLRYSSILVGAALIVISPITIRNWIIYHRVIPVALPAGVNLIQGIAEFDKEASLGMPRSDIDVVRADVEWSGRPEYGGHMWTPDGIARDRERFRRGLVVIRTHPVWYFGAMMRRAAFMISYNQGPDRDWPFSTATVPIISAKPPFGHSIAATAGENSTWSASPRDLIAGGSVSPRVVISLPADQATLSSEDSGYEDELTTGPISVKKHTDYVLELTANVKQGNAAAKVIDANSRVVLASVIIPAQAESGGRRRHDDAADSTEPLVHVAFASGSASDARLVLSNNGATSGGLILDLGKADLFELGPTPARWTRSIRVVVRAIQKEVFRTGVLLTLVIAGILLLVVARRRRELILLLAVPIYYVITHAPFSTEYRYILAIHCFLFVMASVTVYCAAVAISQAVRYKRKPGMQRSVAGVHRATE